MVQGEWENIRPKKIFKKNGFLSLLWLPMRKNKMALHYMPKQRATTVGRTTWSQ